MVPKTTKLVLLDLTVFKELVCVQNMTNVKCAWLQDKVRVTLGKTAAWPNFPLALKFLLCR